MWIVVVAWVYVVGLIAVSETSVVAGIMTFFGFCVLPLSILLYLTGGKGRRARRAREASANNESNHSGSDNVESRKSKDSKDNNDSHDGNDGSSGD